MINNMLCNNLTISFIFIVNVRRNVEFFDVH